MNALADHKYFDGIKRYVSDFIVENIQILNDNLAYVVVDSCAWVLFHKNSVTMMRKHRNLID